MLPEPTHSVLIGSLLGDGCLSRNGSAYRVRFDHSHNALEYALWKHRLLGEHATSPRSVSVYDKRTHKTYLHIRFDTLTLSELEWYAMRFLSDSRKIVPPTIETMMTELALAVWYMDDGHRRRDCNALRINTHAFTRPDVERLKQMLIAKFGIVSTIHRVVADQHVIYIPANSAYRFCEIIRPYVPPCMGYKLL